MDSYAARSTKPLYRGTQAVWYLLGLLEALLAFRFVLKLLGANPGAGFTDFIYSVTYPFTLPFSTVFGVSQVAGNVFEWTTLLAMVVYWLIAIGLLKLLLMGKSVSTPEAAAKLEASE
ncbi:YggT family protein [Patescibacteria group bacterium]|nr:YggT family protein [Patescibacteria group bacterium]MBU1501020.1 YggT family protein [Patescibacteria group bacterium]MBU2080650.1 YggT family protein [Patescibacteria group bacterium]MBU2124275.1 YggT family protein [Patescibacteria group bacterium]MBU2194401.1 YggT family protein [Patescibacteria group bacterium]